MHPPFSPSCSSSSLPRPQHLCHACSIPPLLCQLSRAIKKNTLHSNWIISWMSSKLKWCSDGSDLVWFWHKVKTRIWQIKTGRKVIELTLNIILRKEKQFHLLPVSEYNKRGYSNFSVSSSVKGCSLHHHGLFKIYKCDRIWGKLKTETFFFVVFFKWPK